MGLIRGVGGNWDNLPRTNNRSEVSISPDLSRSGDYSLLNQILPANPVNGVRVAGASAPLVGRVFEPVLAGLAVGGFVEFQLGDAYDIIDVGGTAVVANIFDVLTPNGVVTDLVFLTRLKTMERFISMVPAGLWRISNVSAAVGPAGTVVGINHLASRQLLTN